MYLNLMIDEMKTDLSTSPVLASSSLTHPSVVCTIRHGLCSSTVLGGLRYVHDVEREEKGKDERVRVREIGETVE